MRLVDPLLWRLPHQGHRAIRGSGSQASFIQKPSIASLCLLTRLLYRSVSTASVSAIPLLISLVPDPRSGLSRVKHSYYPQTLRLETNRWAGLWGLASYHASCCSNISVSHDVVGFFTTVVFSSQAATAFSSNQDSSHTSDPREVNVCVERRY
jgi:hypothetical protein